MKSIGDIDYVLGLKVKRKKECKELKLSQENYCKKSTREVWNNKLLSNHLLCHT